MTIFSKRCWRIWIHCCAARIVWVRPPPRWRYFFLARNSTLRLTVATLEHAGERRGYVLVFEDLSDLLKAQKQAAWREVAQRVAHEIKNPLTPISLSAERILRHLERGRNGNADSSQLIQDCAKTIFSSVETVRTLVNEFSTLARFPAVQPQPSDINEIVESTLSVFKGRLEGIRVTTFLAAEIPEVMADSEAIKRALANLVDNAADAMHGAMLKEIQYPRPLPGHESIEDYGCRYRPRHHARNQGTSFSSLFFHQAARHRSGACDRGKNYRRASRKHPGRREQAGGHEIYCRTTAGFQCAPSHIPTCLMY